MTTSTPGRLSLLTRAVVSLVTVIALTAGVPTLLIRLIGDPIPETWNWNSPVTDEVLLGLVGLLAWIFWAQFVLCLIVEIGAEVRIATGRSADWLSRVPGTFTTQQALARTLVQAVIAVGIGAATVAAPLTPDVAQAAAATTDHTPTTASAAPRSTAGIDRVDQADQGVQGVQVVQGQMTRADIAVTAKSQSRSVTVSKGDSLWTLAERHLGSGEQWRRIAALNSGRTMAGGQTFRDNTTLQPGWTLQIPATTTNTAGQAADDRATDQVTVEPGDSLWSLSKAAYGDGDEWGRLYDANRDHITDPNLIYPQQQLRVPATHPTHPATPTPGRTQRQPAETHLDPIPRETARGPASPPPAGQPTTPDTRTRTDAQNPTTTHQTRSSDATQQDDNIVDAATMMRALGGGGLLLASGVFTALLARRRRQFRNRRSGHTITPTPQNLVPTERAVRACGSAGGAAAQFLDHALRDLAARARRGECDLPEVAAARLSETALELVVTPTETVAPTPWTTSPDGLRWQLSRDIEFESTDAMAPYPTLVAVGLDNQGATWLIDLEAAGIIQFTGDRDVCQGLIRYMAAELATNAWSDDIDVIVDDSTCQLIPINPSRFEHREALDLERLTKTARRIREATETTGLGVLAGRADGRGGDTWLPTVLLSSNGATDSAPQMQRPGGLEELAEELSAQGRRSAVAFVGTALWHEPQALVLRLTAAGLLENPWAEPLRPNTLSSEEALILGQLFDEGEEEDETSGGDLMPASTGDRPADSVTNAAGALRDELTEPRKPQGEGPHSLLPMPDADYLQRAATTTEDLQALAPSLSPATAADTRALDPDLDADLSEWEIDTPRRPRLRVLGPVELQVRGPRPTDVERRVAYYTELVAYLALRPKGTPPLQMAEAFNIQANTLHSRINVLRKWLGTNDSADKWHLPESTLSASARARGVPIYQLFGLLCDADLFKRLRARGQTLGAEGMGDLVRALELVEGTPFDQLRPGGYGWLADTPHDHYLTAAIVDVAHVVATDALSRNDTERAAWAAGIGITAAPSEDKPRLDLARALTTQPGAYPGSPLILNRTDDTKPPPPPTARTQAILLTPATDQPRRAADG